MSGFRLIAAPRFRDEVEALGLDEPGAVERWRATGTPVAGGRGGSVRVRLPGSGTAVHLRALLHGGWLRGLTGRRFLRTARPAAELDVTLTLREAGAPVPDPVLVVARRRGAFWHVDVGTRFVEPGESLASLLAGRHPSGDLDAIRACGRAVRRFHDAGGSHRDLHTGNLLVSGAEAVVVDLDGARRLASVPVARRRRELARFEHSLRRHHAAHPALPAVRAAFLEGYGSLDGAG